VDFQRNADQQAIVEAVEALLAQQAGAARAVALHPKAEYDVALERALAEAGFSGIAREEGTGPLEAAMVVEAVSRAAGVVSVGASSLVLPALTQAAPEGPIALVRRGAAGPVRYAAHARTALVLDGDTARIATLAPAAARPVRSTFGYPMGAFEDCEFAAAESLGSGSGPRLLDWWRLAVTVEAVGCMSAALTYTVSYLKERRQFGRPIGSFQAVQHRLAECAIQVEGSRWLAYEAAWRDAPREATATALAYTMAAASRVFRETHQLSGAIGFTREHDLHVWSMRLHALNLELGGLGAHRRAVAAARWGSAQP
jgi:alkylation response protein AidB-like acyl-CoA dehydrogenase